ncbi:MAG: hypothetical protein PHX68_02380 [Alphaproteobacteria bacterium]|nr:hypothetical protein [Alphaproteobacteria bacterium]
MKTERKDIRNRAAGTRNWCIPRAPSERKDACFFNQKLISLPKTPYVVVAPSTSCVKHFISLFSKKFVDFRIPSF